MFFVFLSQQFISQRAIQTSLEKQCDPLGPSMTPEGYLPESLRFTYNHLRFSRGGGGGGGGGGPDPLSPLWICQ